MKYSAKSFKSFCLLIILTVLAGCGPRESEKIDSSEAAYSGEAVASDASNATHLGDVTYRGIYDEPVTLRDGEYEGEPFVAGGASRPTVSLVQDLILGGDLDGDGEDEAVVFLSESSGGSGTNTYIAVVAKEGEYLRNVATALLGNRVQIRTADVSGGVIALNVVQAGPEDAMCCPSQTARRTWKLEDGALVEQPVQDVGTLSLDILAGTEWKLEWIRRQAPVADFVEITLQYEDGQFVGSGGCNRYFAQVDAGDAPGDIKVGPAGSTRRMCPEPQMSAESEYLEALGNAVKFSFFNTRLTLTYETFDGLEMLVFTPPGYVRPQQ